jgi:hypothetical protein
MWTCHASQTGGGAGVEVEGVCGWGGRLGWATGQCLEVEVGVGCTPPGGWGAGVIGRGCYVLCRHVVEARQVGRGGGQQSEGSLD